jgi:hypothetical protein
MARYPIERVEAILDGKPSRVPTPTTLSGSPAAIRSYAKTIAWLGDGHWNVVTRESSRTTNRHIDATRRVLESRNEFPVRIVSYWTGEPVS